MRFIMPLFFVLRVGERRRVGVEREEEGWGGRVVWWKRGSHSR